MYNSNPYIFIPFYLIKSINGKVVILPTPIQKHITINRFISPYLKYFVFRIISINCYSKFFIAVKHYLTMTVYIKYVFTIILLIEVQIQTMRY